MSTPSNVLAWSWAATMLVSFLSPAARGDALVDHLSQRLVDAEEQTASIQRRLVDQLEPKAAALWRQLDGLAGAADEVRGAEQSVRELNNTWQSLTRGRLQTREELEAIDRAARELAVAQRRLRLAQAARQAEVRRQTAQSAEGRQLLAERDAVEAEVLAMRKQLTEASARAAAIRARLKNYQAPASGRALAPGEILAIAPPGDAPQRSKRFEDRNSPASLAVLSRAFFERVDRNTPGLERARAALEAGQHAAALQAWRDAVFTRLRNPERLGLSPTWREELDTASRLRRPDPERLDEAMRDIYATPRAKASVGPPGAINWGDPGPDPAVDPLRNRYLDFYTMRGQDGFVDVLGPHLVLLEGYAASGEPRYLERWAAVLDDWALNAPGDMERSAAAIRQYPVLCSYRPVALASTLTDVLLAQPELAQRMPAPTLARVMLAVMEEYPASFARLARSGIYNWRCIAMPGAVLTARIWPEFFAARWQLNEARRLMELNWSHKILRDGGNLEQGNWGHEPNDQVHLGRAVRLLEFAPPSWMDDAWRSEWRDNVRVNARYYLHLLKPDGYCYKFSRVFTADKLVRHGRFDDEEMPIQVNLLLGEPEARRRLERVFSGGTEPPRITSESLAYFGAAILRESWEPDAAFLYFQSSPHPNTGGREDANGFALHAYGHAQLLAPPLAVDGRTQNRHHGLVRDPGGKTIYLACDQDGPPVDHRFHASDRFDLTEGTYRGVYQLHHGPEADVFGEYGHLKWAEAQRKQGDTDQPIRDVTHARQLAAVRGHDLVIVTDRWTSDRQRVFSQHYTLFTPIARDGWKRRIELAQAEGRPPLRIDEHAGTLRTDNYALPGVSIRHFSPSPPSCQVTHDSRETLGSADTADEALARLGSPKLKKWTQGLPLPLQHKVRMDWATSGPQVLVTAIATGPGTFGGAPFAGDLTDVEPITGADFTGFQATTRQGARVSYLAAHAGFNTHPNALLAAGRVQIEGEALLVVEDRGPTSGLALGCRRFQLDGKTRAVPGDLEFVVTRDGWQMTPIWRPIQPVVIAPATTVFTDRVHVELTCETPGVEIRYTLDGTDPGPDSPRYQGPLTLRETTRVKARAFRPGLVMMPWTADNTQATVMTWTTFERQAPLEPVEVAAARPGLAWEYLEGRWAQLFLDAERLPAAKKGVSAGWLDVSMRTTEGAFAVRCQGYLRVPADGVYTFHAPREWLRPDVECGYDLRVVVHDRPWQPATRRHAHGTWSIALRRGAHPLQVVFTDFRPRQPKPELWAGFPHPDVLWQGTVPQLEISGPGLPRSAIPEHLLAH